MAQPKKWSGLKKTLPKFEQPPEYKQKIEEARTIYAGCDTAALARYFVLRRNEKKRLEDSVSAQNVQIEALSSLLIEQLEATDTQKLTLATGETVSIKDEPYSSIEDRDKVLAWIRKKKMTSLLSLPYQTLNGLVKELLQSGRPVMPGVKVYMKSKATVRAATGAAAQEEE